MAIPKKVLEELGLSDKEARTYLTSLELGPSPVQKIAQKAGINRATTYVCLEALQKLGLVSTVQKGVKTYFTPEHPEQLMALVSKQQKEIERKKEELESVISDLKSSYESAGERPVVRFFEGKEGLDSIREDFIRSSKSKDIVMGFSSLDGLYSVFPFHPKEYTSRRIQKGTFSKIIYTYTGGAILKATDKQARRESRFIPYEKFPMDGDITIYSKDRVAMVSYEKGMGGVIIENKDLADMMRVVFKLAWETAEKYNKEK